MTNAERIAQQFHEAYERLAPSFGYETRRESAVPWDEVPENNRRLMTAVAAEVMFTAEAAEARVRELEAALREARGWIRGARDNETAECLSCCGISAHRAGCRQAAFVARIDALLATAERETT